MSDLLLDHLIGGGQQCFRDCEAEGFGGLEVDHERESGRSHHWQIPCIFSLQDAANVDSALASHIIITLEPIAHQATCFCEAWMERNRWHCMARGERDDLYPTVDEKRLRSNHKCTDPPLYEADKGAVNFSFGAGGEDFNLAPY